MRGFISIMDKINFVLKWFLIILLAVAFIALVLQVFSRFILQVPITWTEELSRYAMIWIAFIGAGIAVRHQQLIRIEAVTNYLSRRMNVTVNSVASIVILVFCVTVFYFGLDLLTVVHHQTSPALHVPMSVPYSSILVGCLVMSCNTVVCFLEELTKKENKA